MGKRRNLIYSAQYEKWKLPDEVVEPSPERTTQLSAQFKELVRKYDEESVYITIPGRETLAESFIELAKEYARISETDINIYQEFGEVCVWLYCTTGGVVGVEKKLFSHFIILSDDVEIIANPRNTPAWCSYLLVLTLYTHRHFIDGREISPFNT